MLVQFITTGGKESWTSDVDSLKDKTLLKEFKTQVPRLAHVDLELMWVEPGYMGRFLTGLEVVGRFWRDEAGEAIGAGASGKGRGGHA